MKVGALRYNVLFKKAFSRVRVFKAFVRDVLGIELDIETVETERSFDKPIGPVDVRFDLFAEDKKRRLVLDIQHERYEDHYHRFLHYHCAAILQQIRSAEDYKPGATVYTIVVLTSGDRHRKAMSVIDFDPKDLDGKPLNEIRHRAIFLCPKYADERLSPELREWLELIQDSLDGEVDEGRFSRPELREVLEAIEEDTISPKERARMLDENSQAKLLRQMQEEQQQVAAELVRLQAETLRVEQEKVRAEQEKVRAEQEKVRAEQEKVRAEQETAEARDALEKAESARKQAEESALQQARVAVEELCEVLGIELDAERRAGLLASSMEQLADLRATLKSSRRWPA